MLKSFTAIPLDNYTAATMTAYPANNPDRIVDIVSAFHSGDPAPSQWTTLGFSKPDLFGDRIVMEPDGLTVLFNVEFRERLLPGAVIKDAVKKRVADLEAQGGRRLKRNEIMNVKDDIVADLLPGALIKSRRVLVAVLKRPGNKVGNWLVIGSPAAKTVESVLMLLRRAFDRADMRFPIWQRETDAWFKSVLMDKGGEDDIFWPGEEVSLVKGSQTIKFKGFELVADKINQHITDGFRVSSMEIVARDPKEDATVAEFNLSDKLIFRRFKLPDLLVKTSRDEVKGDGDIAEFAADTVLFSHTIRKVLDQLQGELPEPTATDEDDEL